MIDISELTLKKYMGLKGLKSKDFPNPTTLSNIFSGGKNVGKFNENYTGDKDYFPSSKSITIIANTLDLPEDDTKVLITNEIAEKNNQVG